MLSKNLKKVRTRTGWSQERLAEELSVSRQTISKWETGETYPSMRHILTLSEILRCGFNELVEGEELQGGGERVESIELQELSSTETKGLLSNGPRIRNVLLWGVSMAAILTIILTTIVTINFSRSSDSANVAKLEILEKVVDAASNTITFEAGKSTDKKVVGYGVATEGKKFYVKCSFYNEGKPCMAIIYFCNEGDGYTYECQILDDPEYRPAGEYYEVG